MSGDKLWRGSLLASLILAVSLPFTGAEAADNRGLTVFEESYSARGRAALDVEVGDADVSLAPHDGSGFRVQVIAHSPDNASEEWAREVFERCDFKARLDDNTLKIRAEEPRISRSEYRGEGHVWLQVRILHPISADCRVSTGDGDVYVKEIDGELVVHTGDGDIDLRSIRGPSLEAHTGDGDISVETLISSSASVHTGDGDVSIGRLNGPLTVQTGDGDIDIHLGDPGDVKLRTGDGDVLLWAKSDLRASVDFRSDDVVVEGFVLKGSLKHDRIYGDLNGGGHLIRVTTGDGSIVLRPM